MTTSLGFGHQSHPLIGRLVVDHAHDDRIGILRAFAPVVKGNNLGPGIKVLNMPPVAWLAPPDGGLEWTTSPDAIEAAR